MSPGRRTVILAGILAACGASPVADDCGRVTFDDQPEPRWVQLDGAAPTVVAVAGGTRPVAGRTHEGPQGPAFYPTFPLTPGLTYSVQSADCQTEFTVPRAAKSTPRVVAVYPSAPEIPENVLRFYVQFSRPMAEGDFLRHVRLERADTGENLTGVFFDNIHELWSSDRTRITLLVDPGRVKTGLKAHQALGRAFEAGGRYRLHVLPTWTSAVGVPLDSGFVHEFSATVEDRQRVDPHTWTLSLPASGTRDPLRVDFHESVDHVSVHRLVRVASPAGEPLRGEWELGTHERTAAWTPRVPWGPDIASHRLMVSGRFEDVAANNLNAALDHPVGDRPTGDEGRIVERRLGGG